MRTTQTKKSMTHRLVPFVRCFRDVCKCQHYWKENRCFPTTRTDYRRCYKVSEKMYMKELNKPVDIIPFTPGPMQVPYL
jgi:hypothetical protein